MIDINDREQQLLLSLVEQYITDGQPVGSKTLSAREQYSPATIRNVMAALEDKGYLSSPHTSAGRVPTESGYRFFAEVALKITKEQPDPQWLSNHKSIIQRSMREEASPQELLTQVSASLSELTKLAGVVTLPVHPQVTLEHIEFLKLSERRLLTVIVLSNQEVQNRVFEIDHPYDERLLQQTSNYLNHHYQGYTLSAIKNSLLNDMEHSRDAAQAQMNALIQAANQILDPELITPPKDFVVSGETNLMSVSTPEQLDRLKGLFEAFKQKSYFYQLFEDCMASDQIRIFIGNESDHPILQDYSLVAAPYKADDQIVGVLGVIGPTRMPYGQAIQSVDLTAKVFESVLNYNG